MPPEALLPYSVRDGRALPHYLVEGDHPWLRALIDEHDRFVGRPRRELDERLREPLPCDGPRGKRAIAAHVLARAYGSRSENAIRPIETRAAVFAAAALESDRRTVLESVARDLDVATPALEEALFADLPGERRVAPPERPIAPTELALRANLALVQGMLYRSLRVEVDLVGNARAVVRHAKLRGLICSVLPRDGSGSLERAAVEISGPLAILRRTLLYGRALAELVPLLCWCSRFRLRGQCVLRGQTLELVVATGDPLFPAQEPRLYDSRLEERFARDFRRLAPDWDVIREPEPVEAGGKLIFPDFLIRHRRTPARRYFLEIVGFWMPEYVARKLADLRTARLETLILCLDEERNVSDIDLPPGAPVVRFRRRIDPSAVLAAMMAAHPSRPTQCARPQDVR